MPGLTKDQVTYQVSQWAANDREVLERARKILAGEPERHADKSRPDLLALFISDMVHTQGNGFCYVVDSPPLRPFWDHEAMMGLRADVNRFDLYVTGVDWDAVAEELRPEADA